MKAFIDSDILIWHLRGEKKARNFLRKLRDKEKYELWTGATQRAEILFFMRENEKNETLQFLSLFKTAIVDQALVNEAGILFRKWNPSHGIDANDALLAASTMKSGGILFSLNKKHYPMPDLLTKQAWK
jgi:predicted nucleic acid-binding protein